MKLNKINMSSYYNNKYTIDNQIKLNNRTKILNVNRINNINGKFYRYNNKNNSCSIISEYTSSNIEINKGKKIEKDEDKLIIKTSLIKQNNENNEKKEANKKDKYHINFDLLSKAGIKDNININMTFI